MPLVPRIYYKNDMILKLNAEGLRDANKINENNVTR